MKKEKIIVATVPGRFPGNRFPCPFPSRWTSIAENFPVYHFYPYELAYLSALLKRELSNTDVKMIDGAFLRFTPEEYIRRLEMEKPDWLVFEVDTVTYAQTLIVARAIKNRFGTLIIMAGQYPTAFPEKVIEDGNDYACIGEFEATVMELIQGNEPATIKGLYPNRYRQVIDPDWLPFPEDDDICRIDYSHPGGHRWMKYIEIEMFASRGCPYSCDFCVAGSVYYEKPNWRFRDPANIVKEIETMRRKYPKMEGAFFDEETHVVNKKKNMELCDALIASGNNDLHYEAMANYQFLDEEILVALKKAGYYKLRIGIESVNSDTGKSIGRKTAPRKLEELLKLAKKIGIEMYGSFVVGASGSTSERDRETIEYGKKIIANDLLSSYQNSIAVPHPGTPFYKKALDNRWITTDNHENFDGVTQGVVNYPDYTSKEIHGSLSAMSLEFDSVSKRDTVNIVRSSWGEKTALPAKDRDVARSRVKELEELFCEEKYAQVVEKAEELAKELPQLLKNDYLRASSLRRLGKRAEAITAFTRLTEKAIDFDDALRFGGNAHFHLAEMLIEEGRDDEAMLHLRRCMYLCPDHCKARDRYWEILERAGKAAIEPA